MTWVWIALVGWVALAVPLGLLAGRYLRCSEEHDSGAAGIAPGRLAVDWSEWPERRATGRHARQRQQPDSIARSVHPPGGEHSPERGAGVGRPGAASPAGSRRRFPPHLHR